MSLIPAFSRILVDPLLSGRVWARILPTFRDDSAISISWRAIAVPYPFPSKGGR